MDSSIFLFINGLAGKNALLDSIGYFFSEYLVYILAITTLFLWFVPKFKKNVFIALVAGLIARLLVVEPLKRIVDRPRPFETLGAHLLEKVNNDNLSFSSGHTVVLFSIAFAFRRTKFFWPIFVLALAGSLARIYAGVHYPSDVLASIVIAWTVNLAVELLVKKVGPIRRFLLK